MGRARDAGHIAAALSVGVVRVGPASCSGVGGELTRVRAAVWVLLVGAVGGLFVAAVYVPPLHDSAAAAAALQYEPAVHGLQYVARVLSWYLPASQCKHSPSPRVGATVPAAQSYGLTLPVGAKEPGAVSVHSLALAKLVELE
eukprot:3466339-Prymnesium_polylepis.5